MLKKWIYDCFGTNATQKNEETICFNNIKKLIIIETACKLPDIYDKWKVIAFFDKANELIETLLGGNIEFILLNPNEIPYSNTKSIKYSVNMFNKKTKTILHRFTFYFKYNSLEMGPVLIIKPSQNEPVVSNQWNFIESLFYNMGFQIRKKYHKNSKI
jgi:hypothetical protein